MNVYHFKRYNRGRLMAEGAKITAETEADALKTAKVLFQRDDPNSWRDDRFELESIEELAEMRENA